jgi:uncharacterized protein (TIRG00374 family)
MNQKLFSFIKYLILLIIAAALILLAFQDVDVRKIIKNILHANMFWVVISGLISVIAFVVRAYRWKLLIEPLGYSPSLKKTTYSLMVGYFANLAFPRLGEISRCGALSKAEAIPFNKLLGTVIVERVIDVISLLLCMFLAAVIEYKRLGNFFSENIFNPASEKIKQLIKSPSAIIISFILLAALVFTIFYLLKKSKQKNAESGFVKLLNGLVTGLRSVADLKRPWLFIFHSVFIWVLYFLGMYVCLFALPSTSHLGLSAALFLLVAGGLGMSAPVQGGIGAYHLLVSQGLLLYGLSQQDGLTFATLVHMLSLVLVVLFGIASLFLLFSAEKANNSK